MNEDDNTINTTSWHPENIQQLKQCAEELKIAKAEVAQFNNEIAAKVYTLCNEWIEICCDLHVVSSWSRFLLGIEHT